MPHVICSLSHGIAGRLESGALGLWAAICLAHVAAGGVWAQDASPAALRVMSFNIRYANDGDGPNRWAARRELFVDTVRQFDPDLLGTQETLASQADDLQQALAGYSFVGVGRDDGARKGEMTAVFYRTARFDLVDSGHFWLSKTPDVPGSKSWDAAITRMVTWLRLRDKSRHEFVWFNTHFDHQGDEARLQSARILRARAAKLGDVPIVVTGDFNAAPATEPYDALLASDPSGAAGLRFVDSYREVHPQAAPDEATFHDFAGTTRGARIDWILHSRHFRATAAAIDRTSRDGRYPSDHFAVTAVLERI